MSKSKGNVVAPDEWVNRYGTDTVRAYLMFAFDWEKGGPWSSQGIQGVVRWLNDIWEIVLREVSQTNGDTAQGDRELRRKTHQGIKKITDSLQDFKFNTAVAGLMELRNAFQKADQVSADVWEECIRTLLLLMAPFTPHIAEELWERLGYGYSIHQQSWPHYDETIAAEDEITLIVQVNGKVRDRITVPVDIAETDAIALALNSVNVQRHLQGQEPKKVIYVQQRGMVSIVI
jgi:leucyl-tRNA synthetase